MVAWRCSGGRCERGNAKAKSDTTPTLPPRAPIGGPPTLATDRQLDYIESLLNSTGLTLSAATRDALGRSVSMDGLSIGEASDLIDYLKELPGGRQGDASRRRAANRGGKLGVVELRPLLNRIDVLVVDVETTGLGDRAEVLAIAVIDTTGRVLLDTVSMPQGRIPTEASNVHGLTRPPPAQHGSPPLAGGPWRVGGASPWRQDRDRLERRI